MSADSIAKSIGHHAHWGFSAGFDFIEALTSANASSNNGAAEPINILLVQPGDIRHLLFTISRRRRHMEKFGGKMPRINFYLLEAPVETLARDLLLLQILTDFQVPIRQRANVYLEVFGNNKVQRRTSEYVQTLGRQLKVLSAKGTGQLDHVIDFSLLNYREKDLFEAALQAYETTFPFDMDKLYDHRQRGFYEDRFDSRRALADWDYHAGIIKKASIVHIKQYRQWKLTGIAFEFGDQTYSEPNRTMMTYTEGFIKKGKEKGLKKEVSA
jgi:dynein assembly factor 3